MVTVLAGNPVIDLITTAVTAAEYNTESLTSLGVTAGSETVNATKFTVDAYGRLTSATNVPIATATEGSKYAIYNAGTAYVRYDIIQNASKVYQAITSISAGAGAPTHSSWRFWRLALPRGLKQRNRRDWLVLHRKISMLTATGMSPSPH